MEEKILDSIKKMLGITETEKNFDNALLNYINSSMTTVFQIGYNSNKNLVIDATTKWVVLGESVYITNQIKTYIYLKVKLLFDPPANATLVEAINNQIKEHEWRLEELTYNVAEE